MTLSNNEKSGIYNVHCTSYSVRLHCNLCTSYTLYIVHCIFYVVNCTLYNVQCTLYTVHCTVYSVQCISYYNDQYTNKV